MVTSEASALESVPAEVLELESLSSSEEQPAMTRLAATTTAAVRPVRGGSVADWSSGRGRGEARRSFVGLQCGEGMDRTLMGKIGKHWIRERFLHFRVVTVPERTTGAAGHTRMNTVHFLTV
ncbi:hypothetical protein [Corynebacterium variabile]|uniref:hypothetical protein n=1 Tax=Corynebacterium variabile TaxID=1727 RepID=UPI0028B15FAB|nr:hypothetical protein [Corynebacterium variabile]